LHKNQENTPKKSPMTRKIRESSPGQCSQPEYSHQNSGTHLTNIFQDIGGEKITNTMDEPTWKIHGALSRRKTAAQAAPSETKQYKQTENHQHMILKAYNPQIIINNLRHAVKNTTTQGTTVGQLNNEMTEGVFPTSCAKITRGNITKVRTIETTKKVLQYLENCISGNQNSSPGAKSRFTNIGTKILHDIITDIRLWGNNETPDSQSLSNDEDSRPSTLERRPVNNDITIEEMADEGTPSKKPRHEDSAIDNAHAEES
jgi:hypothetical protein